MVPHSLEPGVYLPFGGGGGQECPLFTEQRPLMWRDKVKPRNHVSVWWSRPHAATWKHLKF